MRMFAGLDVGFKRTAVCVVDEAGRIVWRGVDAGPALAAIAGAQVLKVSAPDLVNAQRPQVRLGRRRVADATALGCCHVTLPVGPLDAKLSFRKIDITPLESHHFPAAQPGFPAQ